jgi:autophagy-related protein 2
MINDDLPSNLDYLDASFGTAAGFRELRDEDLDEFDVKDIPTSGISSAGIVSSVGGETIRVLGERGIHIVEHYFDTLPPDSVDDSSQYGLKSVSVFI